MLGWEGHAGPRLRSRWPKTLRCLWPARGNALGDHGRLLVAQGAIGVGENDAQRRRDYRAVRPSSTVQEVAQKAYSAALHTLPQSP